MIYIIPIIFFALWFVYGLLCNSIASTISGTFAALAQGTKARSDRQARRR